MKKIAHIIRNLNPVNGGPSISVPALAKATAECGRYAVELVDFSGASAGATQQQCGLTTRLCLPWSPGSFLGSENSVARLFREVSIIQIHGIWELQTALSGILARRQHIPYVVSVHGMLEPWALRHKARRKALYGLFVERYNLSRAGCLRALTRKEAVDYRKYGLSRPIAIIPNGISLPTTINPDLFLKRYPQLRGKSIALFLSRLHPKKGIDLLCQAWKSITARNPDAHLVIAGPDFDNTQSHLGRQVADLAIGSSVTFTGMLGGEIKSSAFAAAKVFILPSYSEGFSIAVLEALAHARPVIITHQCNFPELGAFGAGWVINPTVAEIEDALHEALSLNPARILAMGQKGRALVESRYDWSVIGRQMCDVYDWMLGGGSAPTSVEILL